MSINPPMVSCPSHLCLHEQESETRAEVEHFIHDRFAAEHGADVKDFLPTLVSCRSTRGELMAAAGFQLASEAPLFLEAYLDAPIEACLASLGMTGCSRNRIVEVGNLATQRPGQARQLIITLTAWFHRRQLEWAVLTLTPVLINSFRRLGLEVHLLADAQQRRLVHSQSDWGHYYAQHPRVVAVSIPASALHFRQAARARLRRPVTDTRRVSNGDRPHA